MAMNNWGGVTEHMSKGSKGFGANRKPARKVVTTEDRETRAKFQQLGRKRDRRLLREALTWLAVTLALLTAVWFIFF